MKDLQTWIAKRIQWRRWGHKVEVDDQRYLHEVIAAGLFHERQQLVRKLARERARRKAAEARMRGQRVGADEWKKLAESALALADTTQRIKEITERYGLDGDGVGEGRPQQQPQQKCEDCGDPVPKRTCYCREGCVHAAGVNPSDGTLAGQRQEGQGE